MATLTPPRRPGLAPRWRFLLVAGGLYLLWLLVYESYLQPDGRLDRHLSLNLAVQCFEAIMSAGGKKKFESFRLDRGSC